MYKGQRHLNVCIIIHFTKLMLYRKQSTLNASKVSSFKVLNKFWENKMSECGWNNVSMSLNVRLIFM